MTFFALQTKDRVPVSSPVEQEIRYKYGVPFYPPFYHTSKNALIACNACIAYNAYMANLTIRSLDDRIKQKLRIRAAEQGHSMEEEVRVILKRALMDEVGREENWVRAVVDRFQAGGGEDMDWPKRRTRRAPPDFSSDDPS
ncbi:MAG: hypothetical protein O2912_03830 [Proteobacteria bacterium]|nr:hypothetical protein [Pseudomonadota bacterium]